MSHHHSKWMGVSPMSSVVMWMCCYPVVYFWEYTSHMHTQTSPVRIASSIPRRRYWKRSALGLFGSGNETKYMLKTWSVKFRLKGYLLIVLWNLFRFVLWEYISGSSYNCFSWDSLSSPRLKLWCNNYIITKCVNMCTKESMERWSSLRLQSDWAKVSTTL